MNNKLTYLRGLEEDKVKEVARAQRNIDWFNRTVEGWEQVVTYEDKNIVRVKYIKKKRRGKGKQ